MHNRIYDTAIIGGGLAGLSTAILLADKGFSVVLFEKEIYPFHKVCGEYISLESWNFIESLGLPLATLNLPIIKKLVVTAPNGTALTQPLDLGGFGISRFLLDDNLKAIAEKKGVVILQDCKVEEAIFGNDIFYIKTTKGNFESKVCCGSFGKRSNLDIKWKRPFTQASNDKLNNYIGIKYHIKINGEADTIALHNFKNGYCGISQIEDDKYCLCYLTNAQNLKDSNNSIEQMERNILSENIHLKHIFDSAEKLYTTPLSISQISFHKKTQVQDHVLCIGDAAGMITPLCGNGMSMAMHGAKLAASCITAYLLQQITRVQMEEKYTHAWKKTFAKRLWTGRTIQRFFGKAQPTNIFVALMKKNPWLTQWIIKKTHGEAF